MSVSDTARTRTLVVLSALTLMLQVAETRGNTERQTRIETAVTESVRLYGEWLGSEPSSIPTLDTLPRLDAGAAMEIESIVAYEVAGRYWTRAEREPAIARGLAWYLQSRVVEHLYNLQYAAPGHSAESVRLFGGHIPWVFPGVQRSRWATLGADPGRRLPSTVDESVFRSATAFATLERYLTWPVLQGALAALAKHANTPLTSKHVNDVVSAAAGQDLGWFFDVAFDPNRRIAYRLEHFATQPATSGCNPPCYQTTVVAARLGNASFTGGSEPGGSDSDSGAALVVEVQFADGQSVRARWDGRDERKEFTFESPSPASVARLDPDGLLLLDSNQLDHRLTREPATNVPLTKWLARWAIWLQHAMLTYTMFV